MTTFKQFFILLMLVFAYSCVDESDRNLELNLKTNEINTAIVQDEGKTDECQFDCAENFGISNDGNPFDEAGVLHNAILCGFYDTYGSFSEGATMANLDELLQSDYDTPTDYDSEIFGEYVLSFIENDELDVYVNNFANKLNGNLINQLFEVMARYDANNLCTIIKDIQGLEELAIHQNNVQDIEQFLIASSVARYSLAFWDPYLQDNPAAMSEFLEKKGFWKKLFTAIADVAGAVAGAIGGSAAGSAGGPAGSIAGGIAGGITGASGASVAADRLWGLWEKD